MDDALPTHDTLQRRSWAAALAEQLNEFGCETPRCRDVGAFAINQPEGALDRIAQPDRFFEHFVEHWG